MPALDAGYGGVFVFYAIAYYKWARGFVLVDHVAVDVCPDWV